MGRRDLGLAAAVALAAFALLSALAPARARLALPRPAALAAARADPGVAADLRHLGPATGTRVTAIDRGLVRVSFYRGSRLVLEAAVDRGGHLRADIRHRPGVLPRGSDLAGRPLLVAGLLAAFLLATLRLPLVSLGNLDALALATLAAPQLLLAQRLATASVLAAYPPLLYLAVRCGVVGLRAGTGRPAAAATPLWRALLPGRSMALLAGAAGVVVAVLSVTSTGVSDVGLASLSGATLLAHGTLPYGHMPPDVVHGDTYPLLSYVVHLPVAALSPVHDAFDDLDAALWVAAAAALGTAGLLAFVARRRLGSAAAPAALAALTFPPALVAASAGANDPLLALCLAGGLALAARAGPAALALTAGAWIKVAPAILLPIWLARRPPRERVAGALAALALSAALALWLLADDGLHGIRAMVHALGFQLQRGSLTSAWSLYGLAGLQRAAEAALLAFVTLAAVRAPREAATPADLRRLAALSAAVLIGLQLVANSWALEYLAWIYPAVFVALLTSATPGSSTVPSALR